MFLLLILCSSKRSFHKIFIYKKAGCTKMEMCYDGESVMPSSYGVMNEEEMTYMEGGKTINMHNVPCNVAKAS